MTPAAQAAQAALIAYIAATTMPTTQLDIQSALDSVGYCQVGPGIIPLTSPLLLTKGATLLGCGMRTVLQPTGTSAAIQLHDATVDQTRVAHLQIDGSKLAAGGRGLFYDNGSNADAFSLSDALHSIEDLIIHHTPSDGVYTTGACREFYAHGIRVYNAQGNGFYIGASDAKLSDCVSGGAALIGFHIYGWGGQLSNCKAFYSHNQGFKLFYKDQLTNCLAQNNWWTGFETYGNDNAFWACKVDDNGMTGSPSDGFYLAGNGNTVYADVYEDRTPALTKHGVTIPLGSINNFVRVRVSKSALNGATSDANAAGLNDMQATTY